MKRELKNMPNNTTPIKILQPWHQDPLVIILNNQDLIAVCQTLGRYCTASKMSHKLKGIRMAKSELKNLNI
jgi:hypothetical protein